MQILLVILLLNVFGVKKVEKTHVVRTTKIKSNGILIATTKNANVRSR